jgi:Uma2 family endonuclease
MTNFTLNFQSIQLNDEQFFQLCQDNRDIKFEIVKSPSTLSGEDILPGFILNLEMIW